MFNVYQIGLYSYSFPTSVLVEMLLSLENRKINKMVLNLAKKRIVNEWVLPRTTEEDKANKSMIFPLLSFLPPLTSQVPLKKKHTSFIKKERTISK